jgi:predicted secreted protein
VAKQTGITSVVTIADAGGTARTISGDVTDFTINQNRNQIDVTGVDKDFVEKLPGLGDYSLSLSGVLDVTAAFSHAVFSSMGTALRPFTISFSSGGTANGTASLESYNVTRAQGGAATWQVTLNCSNGTGIVWS